MFPVDKSKNLWAMTVCDKIWLGVRQSIGLDIRMDIELGVGLDIGLDIRLVGIRMDIFVGVEQQDNHWNNR